MNLKSYMYYPAIIKEAEEGGYTVEVKNDGTSPKCFDTYYTCGDDLNDALFMAQDCIICIADSLIKDRQHVPSGDVVFEGDTHIITLKCHQALKIMLRNIMLEERYRPIDICKKLDMKSQKFNQLMDLYKSTNIDDLFKLYEAIGRPLQISC